MHQDSQTTEECGHGHRAGRGLGPILELTRGLAEDQHQKPDRDGAPNHPGLDQQLQIIIVRMVHEEAGIETAEFRVNNWEGAESPTEEGLLDQHAQTVTIDAEANSSVNFFTGFGVNADQAAGEFVAAHPDEKNNHYRQKRAQHEGLFPTAFALPDQKHE